MEEEEEETEYDDCEVVEGRILLEAEEEPRETLGDVVNAEDPA